MEQAKLFKQKCTVCKLWDNTPTGANHIEGFIVLEVERACPLHGHYLDFKDILSNRFSIEIVKIIEDNNGMVPGTMFDPRE